jgi:hypothetical protein
MKTSMSILGKNNGEPFLETGLRLVGNLRSNIKFLRLADSMIVKGYECASHGHKGVNGARGSLNSYESNNSSHIGGHTHSPELGANSMIVGHLTDKSKQKYAEGGLSSWMQANGGITCRGQRVMMTLKCQFK